MITMRTSGGAVMRTKWTLAAVAAAVCAVIAAPAGVASAEESALDVINQLQQEGYTVNIDRIGTAPLSECVVTSVRNPQTVSQLVPYVGPGIGDRTVLVPAIVSQSVSVSLNCSR
jgi:hypothetical protein